MALSDNSRDINGGLIRAARLGAYGAVDLLLKAGADVHAYYDRALIMASSYGHASVVKVLLIY